MNVFNAKMGAQFPARMNFGGGKVQLARAWGVLYTQV